MRAAEFNEVAEALGDGVGRDDLLAEVAGIPRVAYRTSRGAYFNARLHGFLDGSSHDIRRAERARPTRPRTSARSAGGALLARAMFYLLLADRYGCVYRSDSIRAGVIDAAVKEASRRSFAELVVRDLEQLERARDEDLNRALRFEAMPSPLPMVADAIIQRAGSRDECLTIALEVRQSRQARRFREFCGTVELAIHEGDRPRVEKALADLRRYGLRLTGTVGPATDPAPARELISYASPLAGALFAVLRTPVIEIVDQLRNRRFALLDEVRNSQRGTVAQRRMAEFWTTL
ncbi:hypothetical protein AB0M54_36130 [Actinoplanes sp. NPDC051470]|uniref:hypothetical protein n=1 Tax=Actinoplanes sp. NPDC051470 TaxID=3157224 RepID=UPI003444F491